MQGLAAIAVASALSLYGQDRGYVDSRVCAGCHRQLYESYSRTGMGRSFGRVDATAWSRRKRQWVFEGCLRWLS